MFCCHCRMLFHFSPMFHFSPKPLPPPEIPKKAVMPETEFPRNIIQLHGIPSSRFHTNFHPHIAFGNQSKIKRGVEPKHPRPPRDVPCSPKRDRTKNAKHKGQTTLDITLTIAAAATSRHRSCPPHQLQGDQHHNAGIAPPNISAPAARFPAAEAAADL